MKFVLALTAFFLTISCSESFYYYCKRPTPVEQQRAQAMYNAFGTSLIEMDDARARKLFGCNYRSSDDVYVYKTLFGEKYVLARYGTAVMAAEE
jgi:hypothetical protein